MDLSAIIGGDKSPDKEQKPSIEYTAEVVSPLVSGEVKLTFGESAFTVAALFDVVEIPFAEVNEIAYADYAVMVKTDSGDYTFSRMGEWAEVLRPSMYMKTQRLRFRQTCRRVASRSVSWAAWIKAITSSLCDSTRVKATRSPNSVTIPNQSKR
jgi:hypothetical protein